MNDQLKAAVTVSEMARMCSLSRARFYQLMQEGVFPPPVYLLATRRPVYVEELQEVCLEVRRRNCGVNGRPVLFYARGTPINRPSKPSRKATKATKRDDYPEIRAAVQALGLTSASADDVAQAVKHLYPNGVDGVSQPEVIRAVFLHLRCQESCR